MKKIILALLLLICLGTINAQAWKSKNLNLDVGYVLGSHTGAFYSPAIIIAVEKGVHKWFGVGGLTGLQYNLPKRSKSDGTYSDANYTVPVGGFVNFHFYQMLSDLIDVEIGTRRLDMAIKAGFGARFCHSNRFYFGYDWGVSLLTRYYISKNVGVFVELGHSLLGNFTLGVTAKF